MKTTLFAVIALASCLGGCGLPQPRSMISSQGPGVNLPLIHRDDHIDFGNPALVPLPTNARRSHN